MGASRTRNNRRGSGFSILMPVAAGVLIGIAGFVIKLVMSKITLSPTFLFDILSSPLAYIAGVLGLAGFIIFQKSLYGGKVSTVTPIMNGLSILVPVILAVLFLAESLPTLKIIGVVFIVIGVAGLRG